jgi:D-alanyl-D-alanine carboxypeptidase (penicillin-binding protein 5/6)
VSSAKRGPRRLLSVVLGAASDSTRTQESLKLLNYGFQFYDAVRLYARNEAVATLPVWKGQQSTVKVGFTSDLVLTVPKGFGPRIRSELVSPPTLIAPIAAGQALGTLKLSLDDKPFGEYPVLALEAVPAAGIIGRTVDTIRLWFN